MNVLSSERILSTMATIEERQQRSRTWVRGKDEDTQFSCWVLWIVFLDFSVLTITSKQGF